MTTTWTLVNTIIYRFELTQQGRRIRFDTASLSQQVLQAFGGDTLFRRFSAVDGGSRFDTQVRSSNRTVILAV
ncbi:hypothetical protein O9993_06520 [Vibrio lentus]|nr:hypothetical protein [Vibrio lentus]